MAGLIVVVVVAAAVVVPLALIAVPTGLKAMLGHVVGTKRAAETVVLEGCLGCEENSSKFVSVSWMQLSVLLCCFSHSRYYLVAIARLGDDHVQ